MYLLRIVKVSTDMEKHTNELHIQLRFYWCLYISVMYKFLALTNQILGILGIQNFLKKGFMYVLLFVHQLWPVMVQVSCHLSHRSEIIVYFCVLLQRHLFNTDLV